MKYVCIIDNFKNTSQKNTALLSSLNKLGFKIVGHYTTDKTMVLTGEDKRNPLISYANETRLVKLKNAGKILKITQDGEYAYGIARPYGATKFVSVVTEEEYEVISNTYGRQVVSVIDRPDAAKKEHTDTNTIWFNHEDVNATVARILIHFRNLK